MVLLISNLIGTKLKSLADGSMFDKAAADGQMRGKI